MQKQFQYFKLWLLVLMTISSLCSYSQKRVVKRTTVDIKTVIAPIKVGDTGAQVKNLTAALLSLVEHDIIKAFLAPEHPDVIELKNICTSARNEMGSSVFGPATKALVFYFQVQNGLGDNLRGLVIDVNTADKLNQYLKALGINTSTK